MDIAGSTYLATLESLARSPASTAWYVGSAGLTKISVALRMQQEKWPLEALPVGHPAGRQRMRETSSRGDLDRAEAGRQCSGSRAGAGGRPASFDYRLEIQSPHVPVAATQRRQGACAYVGTRTVWSLSLTRCWESFSKRMAASYRLNFSRLILQVALHEALQVDEARRFVRCITDRQEGYLRV